MTTAGQRLRRRRGNAPSSTEWSGLSSVVARSQRKRRKSAASFSCRCARWALPQACCQMATEDSVMWLQQSACSLCFSTCWRSMRSTWRKVWISCRASSSISMPSASMYGGSLRLLELSRITHIWVSFFIRTRPSAPLKVTALNQKCHRVTSSVRLHCHFPSVMTRETLQLWSLGAHLDHLKRKSWNKIAKRNLMEY